MDVIEDYDCVKISGGVLPTADPEYVLNTKQINFIALGEGEITLAEVAEAVRKKEDLKTLKGTWYKDDNGKIIKNPRNKLVDINVSLPDYSLFDPRRFLDQWVEKYLKLFQLRPIGVVLINVHFVTLQCTTLRLSKKI